MSEYKDYVDENKSYMYQWLERNVTCPFTFMFTFSHYLDMEESDQLTTLGVQFEHKIYGKNQEKENFYFITIQSHEQLQVLLDEYYHLATQNECMIVADQQTVIEVKEYQVSETHCYPMVRCRLAEQEGFATIVAHDGQGFQMVTTNRKWRGKNNIIHTFGNVSVE